MAVTTHDALGLPTLDVLGFSIGGFVAPELALIRPQLVRWMDTEHVAADDFRVVQLTPSGSEASIIISAITSALPGSLQGAATASACVRRG
jgi:pimeloyl-ACP methyl ester carboxylesterase